MNLSNAPVTATLTASDVDRAKAFYTEKLGLVVAPGDVQDPMGGVLLKAGNGTQLYIYNSGAPKATNTVAAFTVEDVLATVNELKAKGVTFESYDMPQLKTDENNIVTNEGLQAAWFKDSEGNIIGIANQ